MKVLSIALIGSALVMSGAVAAKEPSHAKRPVNADKYYGLYQSPSQALAPSKADGADFDQSGTRGRENLAASPSHPEGPGNVAD
jgi:hypothetical protein